MSTPRPYLRHAAAGAAIALFAGGLTVISAPQAVGPAPLEPVTAVALSASNGEAQFERDVLSLINKARASKRKCGNKTYAKAKALKWNDQLAVAAEAHSVDMATLDYFSHTSQSGTSAGTRVKATGYRYKAMGETLAAGQTTPKAVVDAWLKSAPHCKILMSKSYTQLGVGYHSGSGYYGHYTSAEFAKPKKK